jgi:hypothetical protein
VGYGQQWADIVAKVPPRFFLDTSTASRNLNEVSQQTFATISAQSDRSSQSYAINTPDANARYSSFDSSRTALAEFIFGCILLHLKALNNDFCGP